MDRNWKTEMLNLNTNRLHTISHTCSLLFDSPLMFYSKVQSFPLFYLVCIYKSSLKLYDPIEEFHYFLVKNFQRQI